MKFTCDLKNLSSAVNNVSLAISSKSNVAILEGVLFKAENNKLLLCGYDSEIGIKTVIDISQMQEGSIVINSKIIRDILHTMPDGDILFEVDSNNVVNIKLGEAEYSIVGFNAQDYPKLPEFDTDKNFEIEANTLKNMINRTIFSVSTSSATPILTGELFKCQDGLFEIAAVDGNRLSIYRCNVVSDNDFEFTIPAKSLNEVVKLLTEYINQDDIEDENEENKKSKKVKKVNIKYDVKHVIFNIGDYEINTGLLAGKFFDYSQNIVREDFTFAICNTIEIIKSMKKVVVIINDKSKNPIRLEVKDDEFLFRCETSLGKAKDIVKQKKEGEDLEIGFNSKYLLDALKACSEEQIKMSFAGSISPIIIKPTENDDFLYLILPVRLKNE